MVKETLEGPGRDGKFEELSPLKPEQVNSPNPG